MKQIISIFLLSCLFTFAFAQGTWQWSKQVHSELEWSTISTEHFRVHYHNGIHDIAVEGANIAETVYPELLEQVNLESTPVIDIIFTTEDEIMNGYAMWTNQTFIWVDQNDAVIWLENGKWLYQVVAHELQHIVYFNKVKSWMVEPWGMLLAKTPGWFVEGLAEYMTEKWRPYRSDISHKYHILKNTTDKMDPHHDGYSKLLLFAEEYGDSSIVKLLEYRNSFKLFNFESAFKDVTGKSVSEFEEHWRRTMNTYFYGYMAQKESYEDIGHVTSLPVKKQRGFAFAPDSLKIVINGKMDKGQYDQSLILAEQDTTTKKEKFNLFNWFKKEETKDDTTTDGTAKKPHYNLIEIDFGRFHNSMNWNSSSTQIAYSKYHFSTNSSMVYDISIYDIETEEHYWLTENMRAKYPIWAPDEKSIIFVSHSNSNSNLFGIDLESKEITQLTHFTGDNQIISPSWSPNGNYIAFARSGNDGATNIYTLDMLNQNIVQLTTNQAVEYAPVWHPSGEKIYFTSHAGNTPNIVELELSSNDSNPITDIGGTLQSVQWNPKGNSLIASTLYDVDSSRIVFIDVEREITTSPLSIRPDYTRWMSKAPDVLLTEFDKISPTEIISDESYAFYKHPKHMTSFILLTDGPFGMTQWSDPLGKHIVSIIGGTTDYSMNTPYSMISYINAQHGPLWGLYYFYNLYWQFRINNASSYGFWEKFDGTQVWAIFPINSKNNMHISHSISTEFSLFDRSFTLCEDIFEDSDCYNFENTNLGFEPESGTDGVFSIKWQYVDKRGHKDNFNLPRYGDGISFKLDFADKNIIGDFTYQRYTLDSFSNYSIGPFTLYGRNKFQAINGTPPGQEYIGLTEDMSIYFPGQGTLGWFENMSPRGWEGGLILGNKISFSTMELRFPLMSSLPINILGLTLGDISGAVISDYGHVWGFEVDEEVITAGYEAKIALKLGNVPLFYISVGEAQTIDNWRDNHTPNPYVRFSLINPF